MPNTPKISVCIPTYNRAAYVGEAIKSALNQTLKDFELIILDDGSTDNTTKVISKFKDPRIKFYKNDKNTGMVPAWNKAVSLASGKYITVLHSDDRYLPGFLEEQSKLLDENPDVGFAFSACRIIDENGDLRWVHKWKKFTHFGLFKTAKDRKTQILKGEKLIKELIFNNFIRFPTVMIRRECYDKVGMYTDKFRFGMDWFMWMQIALHYKVAYSDKALADYRKHSGADTSYLVTIGENAIDDYKVVTAILEEVKTKNIFSKKEEDATLHNIIRNLLQNQFQRIWQRLKQKKWKDTKYEYSRLKEWQKQFNIRPSPADIIAAILPIKL